MSSQFQKQLQAVATPESLALLKNIQRGIEKESLRITPDGKLSQTPHPVGLGSALTPDDRVSAAAWASFSQATVVTIGAGYIFGAFGFRA